MGESQFPCQIFGRPEVTRPERLTKILIREGNGRKTKLYEESSVPVPVVADSGRRFPKSAGSPSTIESFVSHRLTEYRHAAGTVSVLFARPLAVTKLGTVGFAHQQHQAGA
jgi:hypothetical protein